MGRIYGDSYIAGTIRVGFSRIIDNGFRAQSLCVDFPVKFLYKLIAQQRLFQICRLPDI